MKKAYIDANEVRQAARGNWLAVLATLAPHIEDALKRPGRHAGCPIHGGKDGFRLFKDVDQTGGGICNSCGAKSDGISLLMWLNDWSYPEALKHVGGLLGVDSATGSTKRPAARAVQRAVQPEQNTSSKAIATYEGEVHNWGTAPYRHSTSNEKSFFLELRTEDVPIRELWGWGLKPLTTSLKKGQRVRVCNMGRVNGRANVWTVEHLDQDAQEHSEPETELLDQSNVVSLYRDKPWLREVQEKIQQRVEREQQYAVQLKERIAVIWDQCLSILDSAAKPGRIYLNSRGVGMRAISQDALRFHPCLPYHDQEGNKLGEYPCLVAAIRSADGQLVTLHRTYLSSEGAKAKIPGGGSTKKMMPIPHGMSVLGCSIPLLDVGESTILGVAEGMETALSGARATGIPTWAAVSAVLLESFEVPEGVDTVVIWADKDRSRTGEVSAQALAQRLEAQGVNVHIMLPATAIPAQAKSIDWNDVLVKEGVMGFPSPSYIRAIKSQAQ